MDTTPFFIEDNKIEDNRTDFRPKNRGHYFQNRGQTGPILDKKNRGQNLFLQKGELFKIFNNDFMQI